MTTSLLRKFCIANSNRPALNKFKSNQVLTSSRSHIAGRLWLPDPEMDLRSWPTHHQAKSPHTGPPKIAPPRAYNLSLINVLYLFSNIFHECWMFILTCAKFCLGLVINEKATMTSLWYNFSGNIFANSNYKVVY